jgi:beta-lactamase superfamily II metal-dependent hydrolase
MLDITVWDVNHGNATYINTPNDRHIVVDLGDGDDFSPLRHLAATGVPRLDVAMVTHPHRDHLDDIFNLHLLEPSTLWRPNHLTERDIRSGNREVDMSVIDEYLRISAQYNAPVNVFNDFRSRDNFGGVAFEVFVPRSCDRGNLNNHSLVLVVSYAGLKMVIPGDNESASWKELLKDPTFVRAVRGADVFLASHHGRLAGYCPELFEVMGKPRLVIVSDGVHGETSATNYYSNQARGWKVYEPDGVSEQRFCLTTRCDGHIRIKMGWGATGTGNFLNVTTSQADMTKVFARAMGI